VVLHGERVDPEQAMAMKAFQDMIRIIRKRSQLWAAFEHIWKSSCTWSAAPLARGPVHRLAMLIREWGWQWHRPFDIRRPAGGSLNLIEDSPDWIKRQVGNAAQLAILSRMRKPNGTERGQDMRGLEELDLTAATALLRGRVDKALRVTDPLQ
jgi:hypothetical protein